MFSGNFEGAGKPAGERAIEERVADEEHEDDRQKRDAHGANEHFGLEADAKLFAAAFEPETENGAGEDEAKDDECCGDKRRNGVKSEEVAPAFRLERDIERTEREDSGEEKGEDNAANNEAQALTGRGGSHDAAAFPTVGGRNFWSTHSEQRGERETQRYFPVRTMRA